MHQQDDVHICPQPWKKNGQSEEGGPAEQDAREIIAQTRPIQDWLIHPNIKTKALLITILVMFS